MDVNVSKVDIISKAVHWARAANPAESAEGKQMPMEKQVRLLKIVL